ncbi:tobamovirus multiplication protein 1-like isoform x1 [Anaeramoeba flamelloides]|uniref:Tobamovirus multiplication protein 1-like isoform x1 n=1 Tax=Anaeramoeba flamelloides TaxID=1746091 RepID=A0ABQ8XEZ6_9EUKA|nr:tobamovirus multiplication protein 1-like isoform x1 [Anaeramoeba flamelloides]
MWAGTCLISLLTEGGQLWLIYSNITFFLCAVSLLIYSSKLLHLFPSDSNSHLHMRIKKMVRIIMLCTISHLIRIPLITIYQVYNAKMSDYQIGIYIFLYFLLAEIFPAFLIMFFVFELPPKQSEMKKFYVESHSSVSHILEDEGSNNDRELISQRDKSESDFN